MSELQGIRSSSRQIFNALWIAERIIGETPAARVVESLRSRMKRRIEAEISGRGRIERRPVERRRDLGANEFVQRYLKTSTPVVFSGAATEWACCRSWTPQYFAEHCGDVEFMVLPPSAEAMAQAGQITGETLTVREAMARIERGDDSYTRFLPLFRHCPDLLEDVDAKWFLRRRGPGAMLALHQLFVGSAGSNTILHAAMANNLFVQVSGSKEWVLYPPEMSAAIDLVRNRSPYFVSLADASRSGDYPGATLDYLEGYETTLEPGDILYNPPFYWHQVRNPSASIGIGFRWWGPMSILRASITQTLLTLAATDPPFWKQDLASFVRSGAAGWIDARRRSSTARG